MALFGFPSSPKSTTAPVQNASSSPYVFDVGMADFENLVLKASMEKPILVDFWAPWCGPCKQLMPILESEVNAAKGDVVLAKVNIDDNQELAQALRIQSVPTVMAFFQGQPVTGFTGAKPASEIKNLISQLVALAKSAKPDALDIPTALKDAALFLASGDFGNAQDLYLRVLEQDENNVDAYNGLVRCMIDGGALDQAQSMVENAPDLILKNPAFVASKTAIELARGAKEAMAKLKPLMDAVEKTPEDAQVRFDLSCAQFAAGMRESAIDTMLFVIQKHRQWNDDAARKELLRFFEALGFSDPLSIEGRKKLSRLLFS